MFRVGIDKRAIEVEVGCRKARKQITEIQGVLLRGSRLQVRILASQLGFIPTENSTIPSYYIP